MPGLFGAIGFDAPQIDALARDWRAVWPDCEIANAGKGILGVHAFQPGALRHDPSSGVLMGLDGALSAYRASDPVTSTCRKCAESPRPRDANNCIIVDDSSLRWQLASDDTGTFPLYYAEANGGVIFSSRLVGLANAIGAEPDPVGIWQFLNLNYHAGGRTLFQGIRRLQPGETRVYAAGAGLQRVEHSVAPWAHVETDAGRSELQESADAVWEALLEAIHKCGPHALMFSAGWDSRTLAAAGLRSGEESELRAAYFHGNLSSRERALCHSLCELSSLPLIEGQITPDLFAPAELQRVYLTTEDATFPYWHRAGETLKNAGMTCVSAGVFGEVVGGHYGPATRLKGRKKITAVLRSIVGLKSVAAESRNQFTRWIMPRSRSWPWYVRQEFGRDHVAASVMAEQDVAGDVERLRSRGVESHEALCEAFIAEHRGTQYVNRQLLNCRAHLDISLPFCNSKVLRAGASVPLRLKISNALNREILRRHAPQLADVATAATLVSGKRSILAQESSRLARVIGDAWAWNRYYRSKGRIAPPQHGWACLESLRGRPFWDEIVDDLQSDIFDREAIRGRIKEFQSLSIRRKAFPMLNQLLRIYSLDLALRRTGSPRCR